MDKTNMEKLYHGSDTPNLEYIFPNRSGHVHATSDLAFALIFSSGQRNSLTAQWGKTKKGVTYFCERVEGIFNSLYKDLSTSIYLLDSKNFYQKPNMWKYEYVADTKQKVIEEVLIGDVSKKLIDMQKEGNFKLVEYKNRKEFLPNIDKDTIEFAIKMAQKYGKERVLKDVERLRPDILEDVKKEIL